MLLKSEVNKSKTLLNVFTIRFLNIKVMDTPLFRSFKPGFDVFDFLSFIVVHEIFSVKVIRVVVCL